ncbi:MAG: chain length determinant protein EpsF [Vicinamibacterales bacterium]
MTFQQLVLILRARWLVVLGVLATAVGAAVAASVLLPKTYTANAAVILDVNSSDPVAGQAVSGQLAPGYMATQVDIITSERMARQVVTMLKLTSVPATERTWREATGGTGTIEQWLALLLQKDLDATPSRDSHVINISFSGANPQFVSAVANAFARAYIDVSLELRVGPAREYAAWFDTRAAQLRDRLRSAQEALSAYQREKGIVATNESLDYETTRLNEISSQFTQIQALRLDTSSRQQQAGAGNEDAPEVLQSPLISSLKADLVRAETRWQDVQQKLGANHPDYMKAQTEVRWLNERIRVETQRVASSLASADRVNVRREAELRAALEAQKQKVLQLKEERNGLTVVQRDVEDAQKAYDAVSQRLAQSRLEGQIQQTNISVLSPAEPPLGPSSPNLLLNILIGIGLGTVLGLAAALLLELMQRRVRSADDLAETLGVPVLALVGNGTAS